MKRKTQLIFLFILCHRKLLYNFLLSYFSIFFKTCVCVCAVQCTCVINQQFRRAILKFLLNRVLSTLLILCSSDHQMRQYMRVIYSFSFLFLVSFLTFFPVWLFIFILLAPTLFSAALI